MGTSLAWAVQTNFPGAVVALVDAGASITYTAPNKESLLGAAVRSRSSAMVTQVASILAARAGPVGLRNAVSAAAVIRPGRTHTPLVAAIIDAFAPTDVVDALLTVAKADPNLPCDGAVPGVWVGYAGMALGSQATSAQYPGYDAAAILKALAKAGVNLDSSPPNAQGMTIRAFAAKYGVVVA